MQPEDASPTPGSPGQSNVRTIPAKVADITAAISSAIAAALQPLIGQLTVVSARLEQLHNYTKPFPPILGYSSSLAPDSARPPS